MDAYKCDICGEYYDRVGRFDWDLPIQVDGMRYSVALIIEEATARNDVCLFCLQRALEVACFTPIVIGPREEMIRL